jgi:lipopolysaccharide export system permease protein
MKIFTRYLLRAHVGPFLFAFAALTGVILINTLARRLADLAGKGLPGGVVLEFFILALPATIALTFPMSVLVSVLYTFSQFTAENEVTALKATGVDLKRLLLPLLAAAAMIAAFMVWFNDRVLPESNHRWSVLWADIARKTPTLALTAQTINPIRAGDGKAYFMRASRIDPATNRMWDVSIYDVSDPRNARTIYADSGRTHFNATHTDLVLDLYSGHVRQVSLDDPSTFQLIQFREQILGIPGVGNELNVENADNDSYRSDREMTIGMLQAHVDTLAKQRRDARDRAHKAAVEDLEKALAGARSTGPVVDPGGVQPQALAAHTREAAETISGAQRSVDQYDRDIRSFQVEVHKKYSIAFATLVFVIVGAPLALRFPAGGIGMVIASSLLIFSLYYVGLIGGEALADAGRTTPTLAMWIMNAVMTVLGLIGLTRMGRETSTGRSAGWDGVVQALRGLLPAPLRRRWEA